MTQLASGMGMTRWHETVYNLYARTAHGDMVSLLYGHMVTRLHGCIHNKDTVGGTIEAIHEYSRYFEKKASHLARLKLRGS